MAKVKVNVKNLQKFLQDMPRKTQLASNRTIAEVIKDKILQLVSRGISPIEGNGRFPAYKSSTKERKRYPDTVKGSYPSKRRRPVNLFLSGDFLAALKAIPTSVNIISVGFFSDYGKTLEQGHREGANGQAKRPIIPNESEAFTKVILTETLKAYRKSVEDYLNRSR